MSEWGRVGRKRGAGELRKGRESVGPKRCASVCWGRQDKKINAGVTRGRCKEKGSHQSMYMACGNQ